MNTVHRTTFTQTVSTSRLPRKSIIFPLLYLMFSSKATEGDSIIHFCLTPDYIALHSALYNVDIIAVWANLAHSLI